MTKEDICFRFAESAKVQREFVEKYADQILLVGTLLVNAFKANRKVVLFGNGGSATDASHIAAEFVGRYRRNRPPLPAVALATDMAVLTCIANDYDYTEIFSRQIAVHGHKGDVAVAISTSGNSPNVLKGIEAAKMREMVTVGWSGGTGGQLAPLVDYVFIVPSTLTARIQEIHITLGHVLCEFVEEHLFAKAP